jgi:NAD(P)-dependent dehydrogenase (short-subunit alcohol dehydrogenase family)
MSQFNLDGEVALITGGGTGLGLSMAGCFVAAGARVVLVGRRKLPLQAAVKSLGESARFIVADIAAEGAAENIVATAREVAGNAPTILVNNAGIHLKKTAVETTREEFASVIGTNLLAAHALTRAVLPEMIAQRKGNILFITSMAALFGIPLVSAYSASKSACIGLMRTLATEVSPVGVRVNAIAPGWIDSPMLREALAGDAARSDKIIGRTPMARFGEPEDIGWAAVYLCSTAAKFVTGVVLPVDGGASIGF